MNQPVAVAEPAAFAQPDALPTTSTRNKKAKRKLSRRQQNFILIPATFVIVIGFWELLVHIGVLNPIIAPAPSAIAGQFWSLIRAPWFPPHLAATAMETIVGYVIGSAAGLILGIALANLSWFQRVAYPYIITFQVIPKVVLAPIFLAWFGLGYNSKIMLTAAICFFPVVVNTILGLESLEENSVLLMKSLCASKWQTFSKVAFPNALPAIFAGLETSATIAMIGAIVAEFVTARRGLGLLLTTFSNQMKIAAEFAVIVVVSLLALVIYGGVVLLKRKVVFWEKSWKSEVL
jgi:NitT/TauT family transport system permease protein